MLAIVISGVDVARPRPTRRPNLVIAAPIVIAGSLKFQTDKTDAVLVVEMRCSVLPKNALGTECHFLVQTRSIETLTVQRGYKRT